VTEIRPPRYIEPVKPVVPTSACTAAEAAEGRPRPYVVVGVDRSDSARLALGWAQRYVEVAGGTIVATTAVEGTEPGIDDRPEQIAQLDRKTRQDGERASEAMAQAIEEVLGAPARARMVEVIRVGGVADVLCAVAEDADLLVIGHTPRGRLGRALLGLVRPGVVENARCPVVVVPAPEPTG